MESRDARYPIGRFSWDEPVDPAERSARIARIGSLPDALREALAEAGGKDWELRYRPGGWTIRQVVHHIADSHLNAFVRFRRALTENTPAITPYREDRWAELPDIGSTPPEVSLILLEALHQRWEAMLRGLPDEAFSRSVYHPEHDRMIPLDALLALYAWHGDHHLAHVKVALGRRSSGELPEIPH